MIINSKSKPHRILIKIITFGIIVTSFYQNITLAEIKNSYLASTSFTKKPRIRREIYTSFLHKRIIIAEQEEDKRLLELNNANALLVSTGRILVANEVAQDDLVLLRAIIHEEIEALMQIIAMEDRYKFQAIKELILPQKEVLEAYYRLFSPSKKPDLPADLLLNDIIARAVELVFLLEEEMILEEELSSQEAVFVQAIRPIIMANKHNYFTLEFWDSRIRGEKIRIALNKGFRFYQVANTIDDKLAEFASYRPNEFNIYTVDELIVFARMALNLSQKRDDIFWNAFVNIGNVINTRPDCLAFIYNSGERESSDVKVNILLEKAGALYDNYEFADEFVGHALKNVNQHVKGGTALVVIQLADKGNPDDLSKVTVFDNGRGLYDDINGEPVPIQRAVQYKAGFGSNTEHGRGFYEIIVQAGVVLVRSNSETGLCKFSTGRSYLDKGVIDEGVFIPQALDDDDFEMVNTIDVEPIPDAPHNNRGLWLTGYFPQVTSPWLSLHYDAVKEKVIEEFREWNERFSKGTLFKDKQGKVNVMLIGCGGAARDSYLPGIKAAIEQGLDAELVSVVLPGEEEGSADMKRYQRYMRENGFDPEGLITLVSAKEYDSDWEKVEERLNEELENKRVNAVIIGSPEGFHHRYIEWALRNGLHVACDKPVTSRVDVTTDPSLAEKLAEDYDKYLSWLFFWKGGIYSLSKLKASIFWRRLSPKKRSELEEILIEIEEIEREMRETHVYSKINRLGHLKEQAEKLLKRYGFKTKNLQFEVCTKKRYDDVYLRIIEAMKQLPPQALQMLTTDGWWLSPRQLSETNQFRMYGMTADRADGGKLVHTAAHFIDMALLLARYSTTRFDSTRYADDIFVTVSFCRGYDTAIRSHGKKWLSRELALLEEEFNKGFSPERKAEIQEELGKDWENTLRRLFQDGLDIDNLDDQTISKLAKLPEVNIAVQMKVKPRDPRAGSGKTVYIQLMALHEALAKKPNLAGTYDQHFQSRTKSDFVFVLQDGGELVEYRRLGKICGVSESRSCGGAGHHALLVHGNDIDIYDMQAQDDSVSASVDPLYKPIVVRDDIDTVPITRFINSVSLAEQGKVDQIKSLSQLDDHEYDVKMLSAIYQAVAGNYQHDFPKTTRQVSFSVDTRINIKEGKQLAAGVIPSQLENFSVLTQQNAKTEGQEPLFKGIAEKMDRVRETTGYGAIAVQSTVSGGRWGEATEESTGFRYLDDLIALVKRSYDGLADEKLIDWQIAIDKDVENRQAMCQIVFYAEKNGYTYVACQLQLLAYNIEFVDKTDTGLKVHSLDIYQGPFALMTARQESGVLVPRWFYSEKLRDVFEYHPVCGSGYEDAYYALGTQMGKLSGITKETELTETEADNELLTYIKGSVIEITNEELQDLRRRLKDEIKTLNDIKIFFSIPEDRMELFWVKDLRTNKYVYTGGYLDKAGKRIYISLPLLLGRGIDYGIAVVKHCLNHLQDKGHQEDKNTDLIRSIARPERAVLTDIDCLKTLLDDITPDNLKEGRIYEIKYDTSRLSESQQNIIRAYIEILKSRVSSPGNIVEKPFRDVERDYIIKVTCSDMVTGKIGEGQVNVEEDELHYCQLRIIGMFNIALAASNIPNDLDQIDEYKPIIDFIQNQYRDITGEELEIPDSVEEMLTMIKKIDLPKPGKMKLNEVDRLNKVAEELLRSA